MKRHSLAMAALLLFVLAISAGCKKDDSTYNKSFTVEGVTFKMVFVRGGTFTMGGTEEQGVYGNNLFERPTHSVTLSDFYMGETEVTQALWQAVMGNNPSHNVGENLPVEMINWDKCQEFVSKLNTMLASQLGGKQFVMPTEAEWEYAARGGNKSKKYMYSGSNEINEVGWHRDNSEEHTCPVAGKKANELGIYDMTGNVGEWCSDWFGTYSDVAQTNPIGPETGTIRISRGGYFCTMYENCRLSWRGGGNPNEAYNYIGLRLVLK